jgi:hypothetical protein
VGTYKARAHSEPDMSDDGERVTIALFEELIVIAEKCGKVPVHCIACSAYLT